MDKLIANIDALFKLLSDNNHEKINALQESKSDLKNNKNINNILNLCKEESIQVLDKELVAETIELLDKQLSDNIISNTCEAFDINKIPDDLFELCLKILNHPKYRFTIRTKDEKVCFSSNVVNVCRNEWTVAKMTESLDNNEEKIFKEENSEFSFKSVAYICDGCNHSLCPKSMLCVLSYYKNNGQLEKIIESRAGGIKFFNYGWNPEDGLKEVPEDIYQIALKMVDNNQIGVSRELNKNLLDIKMAYNCTNMRDILTAGDLDKLEPYKFGKWKSFSRDVSKKIIDGNCRNLSCRKTFCPFVVAAYIYYLRMTGQEDIITADRIYYFENKEEVFEKVNNIYNQKLEDLKNADNKKEIKSVFEPFKITTSNIDLLVESIFNKIQRNLYCVIEKEDGVSNNLIEEIANALRKEKKIIKKDLGNNKYEKDIRYMNLSSFASKLVVPLSNSASSFGDFQTNKISSNVLYVLDGIEEFLNMQKTFDKATAIYQYPEIRKKQNDCLVEVLCSMESDKYIILQGTKQEINSLLEIDSRLKYIYNNFRLEVKNLTIDELFEIFKRKIEGEVFDIFVKDPENTKNKFVDYVTNNRMLVPFKNEELATYLASYCNSKNGIVFPPDVYKKQSLDESLADIVGLASVKGKVKELEQYTVFYNKARALDLKIPASNMHMIFTGNPGCGKTTIARIMAKMLFDIGIIHENKLIEVERKDLVAEYIGQTAVKTSEVIQKAKGGVLFVDEAYSLVPNDNARDFGQEAIATLIKAMEDYKDDLVVIFAGYKDEMKRFVDSNPGISSRIGYKFDFPDYNAEELTEIFKRKIEKSGFYLDAGVFHEVKMLCSYFVKKKAFGNGRFVDRLIQETLVNHAKNNPENLLLITKNDLPSLEDLSHEHTEKGVSHVALNNIIGLKALKEKVVEFEDYVIFSNKAKKLGLKVPNNNLHMLFRGNPGTGKTTVARIMARMLFDMGVLHENKLIETEKKDFIGQYKGETSIKTAEVIDKALGGVLFIDEAYGLSPTHPSDPAHEAIAALIKAMEDHKGEFIVIFAGYKDEMSGFVDANPGIASRLGYTFDFEDYNADELCQIFDLKMKNAGFIVEENVNEDIIKIMKYFCDVKNFGNGRFVDKLIQEILMNHAKNKSENIEIISKADIPSIKEMISCVFSDRNMINPETITDEALRRTAIHEIGHAFVRYKLFNTPNIKKITINADGSGTLGCVEMNPTYKATRSKKELTNQIKVSLAGMASEAIFTGEFENGNTSDLKKSTRIARDMITRYGMSDIGFGQIFDTSSEMSVLIQNEVNKILKECYNDSEKILSENKEQVLKLVDYLLEHKEIDEEQFLSQL